MKIGSIIKEKRTKLGLTQDDLAKKLQVSRSTISNWEINRNYPDIKLIVNISNILEIPLKELLQEESDIVNRLSEDTIIRKKISKRNKILYLLSFILLISLLSVVIYFSNINDISNKKEILESDERSFTHDFKDIIKKSKEYINIEKQFNDFAKDLNLKFKNTVRCSCSRL